jgi:hypothetical protein
MPSEMRCPKCQYRLSVWEIGAVRNCPRCGIAVRVLGWRGVTAANIAMFVIFGFLMAGAVAQGGVGGWGFFFAILGVWLWAETAAMRALLKVIASTETSGP